VRRTRATSRVYDAVTEAWPDNPPPLTVLENNFRDGWVRPMFKSHGWRDYFVWRSVHTPKGFPDVLALKGCYLVVLELKTETGTLSPEQRPWLEAWLAVQAHVVAVIRPRDWPLLCRLAEFPSSVGQGDFQIENPPARRRAG